MTSGPEKVKLCLHYGGQWVEDNNGVWDYVRSDDSIEIKVRVRTEHTHQSLIGYVEKKFGIERSAAVTKIMYKNEGSLYELTEDEDVKGFMEFAAESNKLISLIVFVDDSMYGGGDAGGSSNAENCESEDQHQIERMYIPQPEFDSQFMPSYDTTSIPEHTYGRSQYYPDFVPETQQVGEENDDEEQEERRFAGFDDDEAHVFTLGMSDVELSETDKDEDEEEVETVTPKSFRGLNDYFDMPPFLPTPEPYITPNQPTTYNRSARITSGQIFDTKDEMMIELGTKFLEEGFEYFTKRSSKSRYKVLCRGDHCSWRMTAGVVGKSPMFHVKELVDVHTCSKTQLIRNHRQANKKVLGHILKEKFIDASRALRPKDIVHDINQQYSITIGYHQGWRARCNALLLVRGTPEESFNRLPTFLYNMELQNPGTRTRIRTDSCRRFEECFAALGCAIRTFLTNLRRVLVIDAAHLKGRFLGTMFLVVAMDANNNIVPIAFGVGRSETGEEWTWFLSMLRECIGQLEGLVFMSDRAASISAAISAVFPTAHHALCCRHLEMNVKSRDKRIKIYKTTYWKACKAYTVREFDRYMMGLRTAIPVGAQVMDQAGKERWSRAHFPGIRYNIMTSNSAESVNAMSRFAHRLPIVGLMEYFRAFQQQWYLIRRDKGGQMQNALTPWAEAKIQKRRSKSATWKVHGIGYGVFEVRDERRISKVDMPHYSCECLKWQLSGLPCGHAIAVARSEGSRDCSNLAIGYFTSENYRATYREVIVPVGPPESWLSPDIPLMPCYPPLITKRRAGRPSNNDRRPSHGEGSIQRKCSKCGVVGHTRAECPNPAESSVPRSRASGSQRRRSQASSELEPHGSIRYDSIDLNVDF